MKKLLIIIFLVAGFSKLTLAQSTDTLKSAIFNAGYKQIVKIKLERGSDDGIIAHEKIDLASDTSTIHFYNTTTLTLYDTVYHIPSSGDYWVIYFDLNQPPLKLLNDSDYVKTINGGILVEAPNVKITGIKEDFYSYSDCSDHPVKITTTLKSPGVVFAKIDESENITASTVKDKQMKFYNRSGIAIKNYPSHSSISITDSVYWIIPFDSKIPPFKLYEDDSISFKCECSRDLATGCAMYATKNNIVCRNDYSEGCVECCNLSYTVNGIDYSGGAVLVNATTVTLERDILKFDGWSDYSNYLNYLNSREFNDSTEDFNEVLQTIEDSLGFYSFRNDLHSQSLVAQANGTFFPDACSDPDIHFIMDPYIRSTLNKDLQFQIADTIFEYIDTFFLAASSNLETLNSTQYDLAASLFTEGVRVISLNTNINIAFGKKEDHQHPMIVKTHHPYCNNLEITCTPYPLTDLYFPVNDKVDYYWHFGDGGLSVHTDSWNNHGTVAHIYSSAGTYTVTVSGSILDVYGNSTSDMWEKTFDVEVGNSTCPDQWNTHNSSLTYPISNHAVLSQNWLINTDYGAFNSYKIGASTIHFEYHFSNGTWYYTEKKVDKILASYSGTVNRSDCSGPYSENGVDVRTTAKSCSLQNGVGFRFYNTSTSLGSSLHSIKVNGTWYSTTLLYFSPCP